tara:strand:+ start:137 stop:565 length:429 start_codon:yes stop_codon:yes gene_type:complete
MRKYLLHVLIISFVLLCNFGCSNTSPVDIEEAKEKVRKNPDDAEAHFNLGLAYGGNATSDGMNKKAIKSFKQAIRLDPDNTTEIRIQGQWENTVKEMSYYYLGVNYSLIFDDIDSALEQYYILYDLDIELAKELLDVIYIEE